MVAVTVGANDALGVRLIRESLQPQRDNFARRNIMAGVTFPAGGINAVPRIHHIGRRRVVLIVAVGVGRAVASHTADIGASVLLGKRLSLVVRVANKARAIFSEHLGCYARQGILGSARLIQKQRRILVNNQCRRTARFLRLRKFRLTHWRAAQ